MGGKGKEGHRTFVALGGAVIGCPEMERAVDHRWNSLESERAAPSGPTQQRASCLTQAPQEPAL